MVKFNKIGGHVACFISGAGNQNKRFGFGRQSIKQNTNMRQIFIHKEDNNQASEIKKLIIGNYWIGGRF